MAASPDQIKYMAHVLRTVGYPVGDGHTPGEMDRAFLTAYNKALPVIWTMVTNGEEGPLKEPMDHDAFERQFRKRINDEKLEPLEAYANDKSYKSPDLGGLIPVSGDALKYFIQREEKNITDAMLSGENKKAFVEILKKPDRMLSALKEVETARVQDQPQIVKVSLQQPAQPAAMPSQQPDPQPQVGHSQADDLTKSVKQVQKYLFSVPEPDGQLTDDLKLKISDHIAKLKDPAKGWNGSVNGEYTDDFYDFLRKNGHTASAAALKNFFDVGGDIMVSPSVAAPAAGKSGTTTVKSAQTADKPDQSAPDAEGGYESRVLGAATMAQAFLASVAEGVNTKKAEIKQKAGLFGSMMISGDELPTPGKVDGNFDEASRTSLQAVLKTFQKQLKLTDDEIYNYTPAVGEKIEANFGNVSKNMTAEQKQALDKFESEDKKKKGIGAIIESLNILKANNNIQDGKLYEGGPSIQLSGMGASILNWVFRLIGGIYPGAVPMMNDMVREYTGGLDYNDLVPSAQRNQDVSAAAGKYAHLLPVERLQAGYREALDSAQQKVGPGATQQEVQKQLYTEMQKSLEAMQVLPFGDEASRKKYKAAYEAAFDAASKTVNSNEAGLAFATNFLSLWDVNTHAGLNVSRHETPTYDPAARTFWVEGTNGNRYNMNDVAETYNELSKRQADSNTAQRPLVFFTGNNGVTMVAGMTAENMFTVQPVTQEVAAELERALHNPDQKAARVELAKAAQANPALSALSVMAGGYGEGYGIEQMRKDINSPLPFETVRRNIYGGNPPPSDQERIQNPQQATQPGSQGDYETYGKRGVPSGEGAQPLSREGAIQRHQANKAEGIRTFNAVKTPQVVDNSNGRVYLQVLENPAGLYALRDQNFNGNLGRAVGAGSHFFAHRDVTSDMQRFTQEFQKFQSADGAYMKNWSQRDQMARFKSEYAVRGGNFERDFPDLAAVANMPAYRRSGMTTADLGEHLAKKVKLDGAAYDRNEGVTIGGWLSNLFGGKSNQSASETGGVQYVERAQVDPVPERPYEGRFGAAHESRVKEFEENSATITGSEMNGVPPGGGGPSATHRNTMRPAA